MLATFARFSSRNNLFFDLSRDLISATFKFYEKLFFFFLFLPNIISFKSISVLWNHFKVTIRQIIVWDETKEDVNQVYFQLGKTNVGYSFSDIVDIWCSQRIHISIHPFQHIFAFVSFEGYLWIYQLFKLHLLNAVNVTMT